ncbi:MAG: 3-isopropylmalate dehydratase small subunit [Nanoarchaeota archaeon]|nr:3-isopropylmalate dehydratase small subunit [Nanoarchaeota archaeon]
MMARVWKFGDNVNTDEIIPARFNITIDEKELAKNVFCEVRKDLPGNIKSGDIIVAGQNFGCGSSREHAPIAIKGTGAVVIAKSYARIFFRNAVNIGLPVLECDTAEIEEGDEVEADIEAGILTDKTKNLTLRLKPLPGFVSKIVAAGGIVKFLREHDIEELQ